jgi:hypothetical protein
MVVLRMSVQAGTANRGYRFFFAVVRDQAGLCKRFITKWFLQ